MNDMKIHQLYFVSTINGKILDKHTPMAIPRTPHTILSLPNDDERVKQWMARQLKKYKP